MKREGKPHHAHQRLIGRRESLQVIVNIAALGEKQDLKITSLAYTLLRHVVRDHPKNGTVLHELYKLPVFEDKADPDRVAYFKQVPIAKFLVEMYRGNAELTYRYSTISSFLTRLQTLLFLILIYTC